MILKRFTSPKGLEIIIRKAIEDDALQIIAHTKLILSSFPEFVLTKPEEFTMTEEQERTWIREHNTDTNAFLAVAETGSKIIGVIHFDIGKRKKVRHSGEFAIAIHPDYLEQKAGAALLECLITWAKQHPSIEKILLNVSEGNDRAIHLYKKFGFTMEGRNVKAIKLDDGRHLDNIPMALFVK